MVLHLRGDFFYRALLESLYKRLASNINGRLISPGELRGCRVVVPRGRKDHADIQCLSNIV